jgi:hypothetical protein
MLQIVGSIDTAIAGLIQSNLNAKVLQSNPEGSPTTGFIA